jgi:hypothetical protein
MRKKPDEMLTRDDWDFHAVPDDELFSCCYWEYARESARIRVFSSPKDSDFFPAPEMQPEITGPGGSVFMKARRSLLNPARMRFAESLRTYALPVKLMLDRAFRIKTVPFGKAWVKVPSSLRRGVVQELEPYFAEKPSLTYLPFNRCLDMRDVGVADENYRCAELDTETGIERFRVQIAWADFTDKEIVAAFHTWVSKNRLQGVGRGNDKGKRKGKGLRAHLAWLGMMRLMNAHPYTSMMACCPDAATFYGKTDWPRSRKKAEMVFRDLFPFLPESDKPIHWKTAGGRTR